MQSKIKTNGPSIGSSPGKWAPTFPKSSVWDLGWRAVPTTNPFLKIYVPCRDRNPNRTETHSCTCCHARQIQESECMKTRQPRLHILHAPKCESSGCPKTFSAFAFLNLQYIFIFDYFALRSCMCMFCAFMFFLHFLSAVVFVCIFKILFFALHAAFFQDSNFLR